MKTQILIVAMVTILLLLIPLAAMQFTDAVDWGLEDFVVMGILLFVFGNGLVFAVRNITKPVHRVVVCAIIVLVFLLIWAELAIGIFGTHWAGS